MEMYDRLFTFKSIKIIIFLIYGDYVSKPVIGQFVSRLSG